MAITYGLKPYLIQVPDINQVNLVNCTLEDESSTSAGATLTFNHQSVACGSSGFTILLNDVIPWTKLSYTLLHESGGSSCWNINHGGSTSYLPSAHNILSYSPAAGDRFYRMTNVFENPSYTEKTFACDNSSNNFLHSNYHTGAYKQFTTVRRRDTGVSALAGPAFGKACIWGPGTTTVSNIRVWI